MSLFAPLRLPFSVNLSLSLLRIYFGVVMTLHGYDKVFGDKGITGWMGSNPPFPEILLAFAALTEFLGGALVAVGLVTRAVAAAMVAVLIGAAKFHFDMDHGFMGKPPTAEMAVSYGVVFLLLATAGPGTFSIDQKLFGGKHT